MSDLFPTPSGCGQQPPYEQLAAFVVFANLSASTCPLPNEFADHTTLFTTWDGVDSERPQCRESLQPFELRVLNAGIAASILD